MNKHARWTWKTIKVNKIKWKFPGYTLGLEEKDLIQVLVACLLRRERKKEKAIKQGGVAD